LQIKENISLKPYNTFGIDVNAKYFTSFNSPDELQEILNVPFVRSLDKLILGGGSNVLFTSSIESLVLKNDIKGIDVILSDEHHVYIKVGAGVNWHQFVLYCLEHNFAGVENLALIPGNAGASPMQNIGAYGVEIKDVFHSLEAVNIEDKNQVIFYNSDCEFSYRESVFKNKFKNQFIITSVTYRLNKIPNYNISYGSIEQELEKMKVETLSIQSIAEAVMAIRKSKLPDPNIIGNAGSFFKNPEISTSHFENLKYYFPDMVGHPNSNGCVKVAAGWLIEQAGWKGYREGDAGCHEKQALVLVNYGKAKGMDIFALSEKIIESVHKKFDIFLHREVNIL
jgi:UDP-N-acetylmuramate dehydrogenase